MGVGAPVILPKSNTLLLESSGEIKLERRGPLGLVLNPTISSVLTSPSTVKVSLGKLLERVIMSAHGGLPTGHGPAFEVSFTLRVKVNEELTAGVLKFSTIAKSAPVNPEPPKIA